ncbi:MAG: class I SAM-dependent methyltransferase [Candidatus Limnocylindria bacterium]
MGEAVTGDRRTIEGFGFEWSTFDQSRRSIEELRRTFDQYFRDFPWDSLPAAAIGFDLGCGTGRWARLVASRVGRMVCVDASEEALRVAARHLDDVGNCRLVLGSAGELPLADRSMDFGYSLGVLHHIPDPQAGLTDAVRVLKPGAPLLVYLYYAFDNRPAWYRTLWWITDRLRLRISTMSPPMRYRVTQAIAAIVYLPLARLALAAEALGLDAERVPLAAYRRRSFYSMRTDALDRFGTRLEKRFTAAQIRAMMEQAGLERIRFAHEPPFWCAVGYRRDPQ